ncbi:DUF2304 domain-containing protein [Collinsella intestinalis]|uniref:DUF2304 domain-containing protein n=1 Tax=Collinsella intestinalis TaxID=147207 RepID=UPI0025A37ADF|nr:DUF2304 domain-containing protein [Collinsella intestinalis]MDM8163009.1 DUF2304 domain-containing protein [Collinsella intestinalis]
MSIVLQLSVAIFCVVLVAYVLRLVAQERLLLKYSLLWLVLAFALLLCAIFPDAIFALSRLFGFVTASNFVFFAGLFCLMAIALSLSVIVSKQTIKIKNLTQRLALIEYEQKADEARLHSSDTTGDAHVD